MEPAAPAPFPIRLTRAHARYILDTFDVVEEEREGLEDLIVSGIPPGEEMKQLYDIAMTGAAEDWQMLMLCAIGMRNERLGKHTGVSGMLDCIWAMSGDGDEDLGRRGGDSGQRLVLPEPSPVRAHSESRAASKIRDSRGKSPYWAEGSSTSELECSAAGGLGLLHATDRGSQTAETDKTPVSDWSNLLDVGSAVGTDDPVSREDSFSLDAEAAASPYCPVQGAQQAGRGDMTRNTYWNNIIHAEDCPTSAAALTSNDGHHIDGGGAPAPATPAPAADIAAAAEEAAAVTPARAAGTAADSDTLWARRSPGTPASRRAATSPYFYPPPPFTAGGTAQSPTGRPSPSKQRPRRGTVSALPVPPLGAARFGLVQEELAHNPFQLLVAVTFLIRTQGRVAIPVFQDLMERYPTPEALAAADGNDIVARTHHLGLSAVRCAIIQRYARTWIAQPPRRDARYAVKNYPCPGDGRDVRAGEEFGAQEDDLLLLPPPPPAVPVDERDERSLELRACGRESAWEIGHLTQGPYAIDSWRIFCRDVLLGRAADWTGRGREPGFQPEWMRVLPRDKELRACLRWMWMKEGWDWDPATGEKNVLRDDLRQAVDDGRVGYDDTGNLRIITD